MNVYSNVLEMVGNTPMLEVKHIDTGPCRLFLKLELMNPGGSIKDRIGISMIGEAENQGAAVRIAGSSASGALAAGATGGASVGPAAWNSAARSPARRASGS